jgi:N-acetyl-anhydromuramyl-L-alanine amidase AmpD
MQRSVILAVAVAGLVACGVRPTAPVGGPLRQDVASQALRLRTPEMPAVREILSPNFSSRNGKAPIVIVWHHTASTATAERTATWFQSPAAKASSHYVVDRSGEVIRSVADDKKAWHAGVSEWQGQTDVSAFSLGIEICNVGDHVEPYPAAEMDAVVRLTAALAAKYGIPVSAITRHRDIAMPPGRKCDTSDTFDTAYAKQAVADLLAGRQPAVYRPKAAPAGYDPTKRYYKVQPGDNLTTIADKHFDSPAMVARIRTLNPGVTITPGAILRLPTEL